MSPWRRRATMMTAAQYLVKALERLGVEVVFGYPGGAIMPLYDAFVGSGLRHVLVRHEQAAAFAADGYARATGRVGVCIATSGPGATNLLTGIANAHMDSVPVVAITGQVPTAMIGTDAFQEVDVIGLTLPVVKHGFMVREPRELPEILAEAFRLAAEGRPGPVLIDLPKDVAATGVGLQPLELVAGARRPAPPEPQSVERAAALLRRAERPLAYAGGGIVLGRLVEPFRGFVDATGMPVVSTLKGLGAVPTRSESFLGMLGMHGLRAANLAVQECDLLVSVGARFDDRATGRLSEFAPAARVIHMDVDPAEVGKLRAVDVAVLGDLAPALEALSMPLAIAPWRRRCLERKRRTAWDYDAPTAGVYAPRFLRDLSEVIGEEGIVVCDVGQHQMWVAQHWHIGRPDRHLSSGGLGAMGYGLPAAIGAQTGCPDRVVVAVTGDGSVLMNVQELATLRRYRLPVRIVLLDNQCLGMVRQWQELFFDRRYSEVELEDNPDFTALAAAFGIEALRIDDAGQVAGALERVAGAARPLLLHVPIDPEANVWPLVPPGQPNTTMIEEEHR